MLVAAKGEARRTPTELDELVRRGDAALDETRTILISMKRHVDALRRNRMQGTPALRFQRLRR